MSHHPLPARPSRLSLMVRSISRPALVGVAAGALAAAVVPATSASAAPDPGTSQSFHRTATYPVYKNLPKDLPASSATVAEISDVSKDGKTLVYTDALGKRIGFLDISDPDRPVGAGSLSLAQLGDTDDQPTSVAVVGKYVLVVVDTSESFTKPSGRLDVVRLSDSKRIRSIDLEGQPDSIDVSAGEDYAAIAIENQRDEEAKPAGRAKGDLPQLPPGFVQVIDLDGAPADWKAHRIDLVGPDGAALPSFVDAGLAEPTDPEPEYVSINGKDRLALTLQENNGIVIIDLATRRIEKVFSAGRVSALGFDTKKDGKISLTDSLTDVVREPDAIGWVDDTHVATANEGDWKGGSRGWTVFDATDGSVTWDAGSSFERLAVQHGLYNDDRAAKKGAEPEGLAISTIDGVRYAFVGSERSNFVAVYDISDPAAPRFRQVLPATNGPEGILPIPGRNLLAVSSETDDAAVNVRASVSLYELGDGPAAFPSIVSDDVAGNPVGWSALGALSAKPGDAGTIYAAADTVLKPAQVFTVDVTRSTAHITSALTISQDGAPATLDVEGLYARPDGGFWLASEGATGAANTIYRTNAAGEIQESVSLPTEISDHVKNWGLEGVTATQDADGEHVWTVIQRQLWTDVKDQTEALDGDDVARIGRYDVKDRTWHWYGYRLDSPKRDGGDWVGLSEITAVDNDTFAVIERDKLNGPQARNKRIYAVDIPADDPVGDELPILDKKPAIDVLPELRATNGWTQEKLEGFTIAADGSLYGVTDNDGLKDSTGETVFLRLGQARDVFADALRSSTTLSLPRRTTAYGQKLTATVTVTGGAGVTPTGTVTVKDGSTTVGRGTVRNGAAKVTLSGLRVGARQLVAEYGGDARTVRGTSEPFAITVAKGATRTSLSIAGKARKGKAKTAKVTVSAEGFAPTGTVTIKNGSKVLKTVHVSGGTRSVTIKLDATGRRSLKAYYAGSSVAKPSASGTVKVRVR
ncbi:esterase-like activity of phytase family protein [Aeromicrobium chenweiae]|uniref:Alkaline phosphatase n=1 Tax=Aeromicrobium chenweiae TaxID=2079793 RepID=A0A2S0WJS3_9ACTN|nr:esterase-like activity of phytase family protein [Aeromicrobium chenweiae]AWB91595.1 alkaline phosphatase [Aeromicrobium chenweiae]TGN32431.1 alkaline phosphatase [Aeromicrobium chenweiae]